MNRELVFHEGERDDLQEYTDADFAGLIDGRKSTSSYVFILASRVISHSSKQQPTVTLSTCEAEYIAITEAGKEAVWLECLLVKVGYCLDRPVQLWDDN